MQFDLLKNDLFSVDESPAPEKKQRSKPSKSSAVASDLPEVSLPPLPASLLSALSQPPDAVFHDIEPEGYELLEDELVGHSQKSPNAFKTISEASQILDVPQHVLRFWESRFSQIKPIKSRGGRRYYRPEDMKILGTIKDLLYKQGYTIKGAKKAFSQIKKTEVQPVSMSAVSANALSFEQVFAQIPSRDSLSHKQISQLTALRNELAGLRDTLKLHMWC